MKRPRGSRFAVPDVLARRLPTHDDGGLTFMQGLALGALVGAAIAGSTLWNRVQSRRASADERPLPRVDGGART
jgi:hypothetical protein